MAKFKYAVDEKTIAKRLKEKRGAGLGATYKPWMYVHEVPSKGKSSIRSGWKTRREHHFLSNLETMFFYVLEWDNDVCDLREQFPLLPLEETKAIARELGIEHPKDPRTKADLVITTDLVPTFKTSIGFEIKARSVKYANDLENQRVQEKQLIEKMYWNRRNIEWNVVTENSIIKAMAQNIKWLHKSRDRFGLFPGLEESKLQLIEAAVLKNLPESKEKLADFTDKLDVHFQVPESTSLTMVKHMIANRKLLVDMHVLIHPCNVIKFTRNE